MNDILRYEKKLYFPDFKSYLIHYVTQGEKYLLWKYITFLRKEEAASNKIIEYYWRRKKNRLGAQLGFKIDAGVFGKGLQLCHYGSVIVHCNAKIGENCKIHGQACIGNDGITSAAPVIGNNVDIGMGAKILGDVIIADNVRIGAGAIVTKSCMEKGATLAGMPAKPIHTSQEIWSIQIASNNSKLNCSSVSTCLIPLYVGIILHRGGFCLLSSFTGSVHRVFIGSRPRIKENAIFYHQQYDPTWLR